MSDFKSRDAAPDAGQPFVDVNGTSRSDTIVRKGETRDAIDGGGGADRISSGGGSDIVRGGAGNDTINGGSGYDILNGGEGRDWLVGGTGNDTLVGGSGNDLLMGGADKDNLYGDEGNDTLVGGAGFDFMRGDEGKDVFKFNAIEESGHNFEPADLIFDFEVGKDKIDLSGIDANADKRGDQAFTVVEHQEGQKLTAGQISSHYDDRWDKTVIEGAVDSDGFTDFKIELQGNIDLSVKDFVL